MKTIEQRARDYAEQANAEFPEICAFDYIAGAKEEHILLTEWHDIESDKDGFITEEAYDRILYNLPVLVKEVATGEVYAINQTDIGDWSEELYYHPSRYKWRKIHE